MAQPLYGLGPIIAAAGVGYLAADAPDQGTRTIFAAACLELAIGALAWAWLLYQRSTRISEFAFGTLASWPFATVGGCRGPGTTGSTPPARTDLGGAFQVELRRWLDFEPAGNGPWIVRG
jgi:hypothetical protein